MQLGLYRRVKRVARGIGGAKRFVVVREGGVYSGDCGQALSQEQFDAWLKRLGSGVVVYVVELACDGEAA